MLDEPCKASVYKVWTMSEYGAGFEEGTGRVSLEGHQGKVSPESDLEVMIIYFTWF